MSIHDISRRLIEKYTEIHAATPDWAWPFNPSIPLVGQEYQSGSGILVYGSAERLNWIGEIANAPERYKGLQSWNRYRVCYEAEGRSSDDFYPSVGIQPAHDGGLMVAGLYASLRLGLEQRPTPREFLEIVSLSNLCKFTVSGSENTDYIDDVDRLRASFPFLTAELSELKPTAVLLPHKAWNLDEVKDTLRAASPDSRFIPLPQFNHWTVNSHLKSFDPRAEALRLQWSDTTLSQWMSNLLSQLRKNGWRYLAWLDDHLPAEMDSDNFDE